MKNNNNNNYDNNTNTNSRLYFQRVEATIFYLIGQKKKI